MATPSALPSFEQLMASLGLQEPEPSRSLAARSQSSVQSMPGHSPSIIVSPVHFEDCERERPRASSYGFGNRTGSRYCPYSNTAHIRRGSLPCDPSEISNSGHECDVRVRSASNSPRAASIHLDDLPLPCAGLKARRAGPGRPLTLLELEMNFPATTPISSLVRRSHQYSPPSPTSSSTSPSPTTPFSYRRRRRSGSSSSSSRSSPPPGLSIPVLPALISMPMTKMPRTSPNARRANVHKQRSSGTVARISAYMPSRSPTEATLLSVESPGFYVPHTGSIST